MSNFVGLMGPESRRGGERVGAIGWLAALLAIINAAGVSFLDAQTHLILAIVSLLLLVVFFARSSPGPSRHIGLIPVWSIICLLFLSTLWSVEPSTTLGSASLSSIAILQGYAIGSRTSAVTLVKVLSVCFTAVCLASALYELYNPISARMAGYYEVGTLKGLVGHRNYLGYVAMLTVLFVTTALVQGIYKKWAMMLCLGLAFYVLFRTQSQTALVLTVLGFATILTLQLLQRMQKKVRPVVLSMVLLVTTLGAVFVGTDLGQVFSFLQRDQSLTGRTGIWQVASETIAHQPILGYGWGAVWTETSSIGASMRSTLGFDVAHAHNGYLDVALQVGIVGGLVVVLGVIIVGGMAFRSVISGQQKIAPLVATLCILLVAYNFFESRIDAELGLLLLGVLLASRQLLRPEADPISENLALMRQEVGTSRA